ncbi:Hypothetical protein ORPV_880 [Orpheovirus IHUMI-LCC2]|uniref:F-box domain-containing protein n=1 Tax=Orpheovirus IHUMI-LCC2 TaxID=2023057 RepID=A0A2I2L5H2_9VIRU|nr:Hypothetical protein ORPV_880 [Orpheovirus IHUMI-LCC2]SNW62784.1 Hypothetical protein ORPV_880 [Orpheovirus IHUMI-LCC2]
MEQLYPNNIFPNLPKEISKHILQNVDPTTLPDLCLVNKDTYKNDCAKLLKYYYGNNGFELINSMNLDQFKRLTSVIWPTLQSFNIQTYQIVKDQMIKRALSLRYNDDIISQMSVPDTLLFAYNRTNLMKSDIDMIQIYSNIVEYLENGGSFNDVLLRLEEDVGNVAIKIAQRIILKYSSYPAIVFHKIKDALFDMKDGNILKDIYELPLSQCDDYIIQNANLIRTSNIRKVAFIVYTQRKTYTPKIAAYLMQYSYNSIKVTTMFTYITVLKDIELLKLSVIILSIFGGEFDYDRLLIPQFNIEGIPELDEFARRRENPLSRLYEYSISEAIVEYSPPIAFTNSMFLNNNLPRGFRILGNVNLGIPGVLDDIRGSYDIIKLFSMLLVDKNAFDINFLYTFLNYVSI